MTTQALPRAKLMRSAAYRRGDLAPVSPAAW